MLVYKGSDNKEYGKFDEKDGTLIKDNLESKHLLWDNNRKGVPALDKLMYDTIKHRVKSIVCITKEGRKYCITGEDFERYKEKINYGHGEQYTCPFNKWFITD